MSTAIRSCVWACAVTVIAALPAFGQQSKTAPNSLERLDACRALATQLGLSGAARAPFIAVCAAGADLPPALTPKIAAPSSAPGGGPPFGAFGPTCSDESRLRSIDGKVPTTVEFVNQTPGPLKVFWLDYEGHRKLYLSLAPNATSKQSTFASHAWVLADAADRCMSVFVASEGTSVVTLKRDY